MSGEHVRADGPLFVVFDCCLGVRASKRLLTPNMVRRFRFTSGSLFDKIFRMVMTMNLTTLGIVGLTSNVIGTGVAAFSGGRYLKLVDTSISALETTLEAYFSKSRDVPFITGLDKHRKTAMRHSKTGVSWGLILIVVGFVLQIVALLV